MSHEVGWEGFEPGWKGLEDGPRSICRWIVPDTVGAYRIRPPYTNMK